MGMQSASPSYTYFRGSLPLHGIWGSTLEKQSETEFLLL